MAAGGVRLLSVDFEVFGKVQGVLFRKHTQKNAVKHGLVGWVMNTKVNTVVGEIQGQSDKIRIMKTWLQTTGSPKSRIDRCVFRNERSLEKLDYKNFQIQKK